MHNDTYSHTEQFHCLKILCVHLVIPACFLTSGNKCPFYVFSTIFFFFFGLFQDAIQVESYNTQPFPFGLFHFIICIFVFSMSFPGLIAYFFLCAQSYPTLCRLMYYSMPDSSVHGISQARILEWVAIPFSRESSRPRAQTCVSCISCIGRQVLFLSLNHLGSPVSAE